MKKALQLAVVLMALVPAIGFGQNSKVAWPEMKAFHDIMSASFHPVEEGNFGPVRANADSLFKAARAWQKSAIPEDKFKPKETKDALRRLVIDCGAVQKAVLANHSDAEIRELITKAHDTFHIIVGECRQSE